VGEVRDSGSPPLCLPTGTARPSPEDQVRFIANIERILSEGSFVATYKYALLVALVELAIERGDDSNRELPLQIRDIAEKFAELYWRQTAPYEADGVSGVPFVLHQNKGKQADAITRLARLRDELKGSRSTLAEARRTAAWKRMVSQMQTLLKRYPKHFDIEERGAPPATIAGRGAGPAGCCRTRPRTDFFVSIHARVARRPCRHPAV
jgi:hypothetical protein